MLRKKVYSPILFFILCCLGSCTNPVKEDGEKYLTLIDKADGFFDKKVQLDSAFYYYNRAKEICYSKEGEDYTYALLQIATIQQHVGDFYGSEETLTEALANYKGSVYKPYLYNMMAVAFDKQKKWDDALLYYQKASKSFKDTIARTLARNNIGLIYQEKNQHEKAIVILKPLLNKHNRKQDDALILNNLGYSQYKLNRPEAYANLLKSYQVTDSLKDVMGSIQTNTHLAEFFRDKDKKKSSQFALNALNAAKQVNNPDDKLESLKYLIQSSEPQAAKKYITDFLKINDSLTTSRNSAKNQFAKIRFDSKKAIENEKKYKSKMQFAFFTVAIIVFLAMLVFWYIRKRNRKKLEASVYETEHRIAKKIHDELANDVFQAMNYAENQDLKNPLNREVLVENLDAIYAKARDISQSNSEIKTDASYSKELLELINSFNSNEVNIIVKNASVIDWNKVNKETKYAVYRVLQELLVNMKKHSEANLVALSFENTSKSLEIKYSDNGKGIDPTTFSKKGLQNAENRIKALKGTFNFDSKTSKGFRVTIQIPK
ncbi:ATP-binding protein [Flavobacterium sp. N1994]|uniref:ATP-binding protein n=1 Tax=Flavobacterium sp. N1994 TaxID=2986827 RepID=UPI0022219022|nr:ATP-binding protein [Flavobacterium sp. N1994]